MNECKFNLLIRYLTIAITFQTVVHPDAHVIYMRIKIRNELTFIMYLNGNITSVN